ncbi:MAG: hypothetical protein RIR57_237 [Bacteroidota bacterium]|jgi:hypothetical protein
MAPKDPNAPKPVSNGKSGRAALDDSTKQIYGPQTMSYSLEEDVLNGRGVKKSVDTSLHLFHRYLFQERSGFLTAHLGNEGTAVRNIFLKKPDQIGTQMGYNAYMPYAFATDEVKYYQTKSPYSDVEYYLGAGGQTRLNFTFARNIDSLWNMGFEIQRQVSDKFLTDQKYKSGNQTLTEQWGVLFQTNFRTRNNRYRLLSHLNYFDMGIQDQGGVQLLNGLDPTTALKYTDNGALFSSAGAQSNDSFLKFHFYHEFIGFKGLQFFQRVDVENRAAKFKDMDFVTNLSNAYYPKNYGTQTDSLYNENQWQSYSHQTGFKGIFRGFTYRTYFKQRYWDLNNPMAGSRRNRLENYVGLFLQQKFNDKIDFTADGEYLLGSDYRLQANFSSPFFQVKVSRTSISPSMAQNWTNNAAFRWDQSLSNVSFDELTGSLDFHTKQVYFRPTATIQRISNYVYFDTLATAKQTSEGIGVFRTGFSAGGTFKRFEWSTLVLANTKTGPDVMRMPNLVASANLALNVQYKKLLYMQFGIDVQHQSAYYADAYMPTIQQYHLQDRYEIPAFVQADVYVTLRINRVRLFFKMQNVSQGLLNSNYYTAYLHQAMPRSFGYGVRWLLFD